MVDRVGQRLGNYRLLSLLGRGGFADVYLGEHIHLRTQAAIKVLQLRLGESNIQNFLNEARTIAHLVHPYIIRVLDFGVQENVPFLVMDHAPRGTFRQRFLRGKPLPPTPLYPYIKQAATALQYAHDKKLVHRDVKPENMLIGPNDEVLLSDFGFALMQNSMSRATSTETVGTAAYMAPEQLQGRPCPASDQYSLGVVAYEWLTGDCPFQGTFYEIASQHMLSQPVPVHKKIPTISPEIGQVVMTALAKRPEQRFPSVRAFATALERACLSSKTVVPGQLQPPPFFQSSPSLSSQPSLSGTVLPPFLSHTLGISGPTGGALPVLPPGSSTAKTHAMPALLSETASRRSIPSSGGQDQQPVGTNEQAPGEVGNQSQRSARLPTLDSTGVQRAIANLKSEQISRRQPPLPSPPLVSGQFSPVPAQFSPEQVSRLQPPSSAGPTARGQAQLSAGQLSPLRSRALSHQPHPEASPALGPNHVSHVFQRSDGPGRAGKVHLSSLSPSLPPGAQARQHSPADAPSLEPSAKSVLNGLPPLGGDALALPEPVFSGTAMSGTFSSSPEQQSKDFAPDVSQASLPGGESAAPQLPRLPIRSRQKISTSMAVFLTLMVVLVIGSVALVALVRNQQENAAVAGTASAQQTQTAHRSGQTATAQAQAQATMIGQITATAQANANPYPPNQGLLTVNDKLDRNDPASQWQEETVANHCGFADGSYHARAAQGVSWPCYAAGREFFNFTYQVEMNFVQMAPSYSSGGIIFRANKESQQAYLFTIYASGRFLFSKCNGSIDPATCTILYNGSQNEDGTIKPPLASFKIGQPNTLAVTAVGSTITLFVNSTRIIDPWVDNTGNPYQQGLIGVFVHGGTDQTIVTDVAFTNAKVWK